jgi:hypothetical protein
MITRFSGQNVLGLDQRKRLFSGTQSTVLFGGAHVLASSFFGTAEWLS